MSNRDLTGRVESVNENGVKIDGNWFNYSRFFEGERTPAKGVTVSAVIGEFKGKDYLNKLVVIGSALPAGVSGNTPVSTQGGTYRSSETNERIARQVALKAAVDYHSDVFVPEATVIAAARIFEKFLAEPYGEGDVEAAA